MAINITLPKITSGNPTEQMRQMQSYVYQLAEQLNWAFSTIEASSPGNVSPDIKIESSEEMTDKEVENTFNSIKSLIIKSADIVKAYEETIREDFNGEYVAISDFGTYTENTTASIEKNSKGITTLYENVQTIGNEVSSVTACIKQGYLGDDRDTGEAVYGIAIGEQDEAGAFKQYAWFTADRLTFFDENKYPVAYIGSGCLYIVGKSVFLGELQLGGYKIDATDGVAFTWIG